MSVSAIVSARKGAQSGSGTGRHFGCQHHADLRNLVVLPSSHFFAAFIGGGGMAGRADNSLKAEVLRQPDDVALLLCWQPLGTVCRCSGGDRHQGQQAAREAPVQPH